MSLILRNLDEKTKRFMLEEVNMDIGTNSLYISDRLNPSGRIQYPDLLTESINNGNDSTLADKLRRGCFNPTYQRRKPKGGFSSVTMPINAPDTLAEGEFNRFYVRALCRIVIDENAGQLKVYRAKHADNPRADSEMKIGQIVNANSLLSDLRRNIGIDTHLGIPAGPNSGLSVELIP